MGADHDTRAELVDELCRLEGLLEQNSHWIAWRALDSRIALGRGPDPQTIGSLVGSYAAALVLDPNYVALLQVRDRIRRQTSPERPSPGIPQKAAGQTALAVRSSATDQPVPLRLAPAPPATALPVALDATWTQAAPVPSQPASGKAPAAQKTGGSSLLDRIATLERDTAALESVNVPPAPKVTPAAEVEEAEVTIVEAAEEPEQPAKGLVSRLWRVAEPLPSPSGAKPKLPADVLATEEAEIEIIDVDDGGPPGGPARAPSSHNRSFSGR